MLTEAQWRRIYAFLCDHAGVDAHWRLFKEAHCRLFVEAVCWMARNDASWRMLPAEYGKWNSVYQRYASWEKKGVWQALREHVQEDADLSALLQKSAIGREQYPGARAVSKATGRI